MPRFAANISFMFTEHPFLDRFAAAANAGFGAVEFLFPYDHPADVIADLLVRHGLTPALFNLPSGDWAAGERGLATDPARFADLQRSVEIGLVYAKATGVGRLHLLAGIADANDPAAMAAYRHAVAWTAERIAPHGLDLLLEPINNRNMLGYFLNDFNVAARLINDLALPNLKLQFDLFHCQILHGDVTMRLRALLPMVGHIQTASVPDRHEPGTGEANDDFLFAELDRLGYAGYVGCEYHPAGTTIDGLGWFERYRTTQTRKVGGQTSQTER